VEPRREKAEEEERENLRNQAKVAALCKFDVGGIIHL